MCASRRDPAPVSLSLRGVSKTFGGQQVLKPFSLEIPAGCRAAVLGPSGCGKTTTLRLIAGLESPDPGGRVFLGGEDVTGTPAERRGVGMVFQDCELFPNLTVAGNVAYGLRARRAPARERRETVSRMLEMVRLADLADRRTEGLSGGQAQRVALARTLAAGPRVLLLDEPLAALDAILRASLREELEDLLGGLGMTTVLVTHDQDEAMTLGDLIVVMRDGRVEQAGSPEEICREPRTPFVAGFVGGGNRLAGRLEGGFLRLAGGAGIPLASLRRGPAGAGDGLPAGPGGRVSVFFRPDRARLGPAAPGRISGTVVSSRSAGLKTRLAIRLEGGEIVKLEMEASPWAPGEAVGVELPPEELHLFADP
ncbi:MAG: ABC transporter ATP-binding protein [Deltaproteobacteria bacterium]|jgi:putative spermidine/putrescine transport system ATP-binding protein|nr:ABC transporter ATP-binding protein [Deltaproteobacteria bacterium]